MKAKKATAEIVATAQLPVPVVNFEYDEDRNVLKFSGEFDFNFPDEAIIERLGRVPKDEAGNPTGEPKPVTSRIYGKAKGLFTGSTDNDENAIYLDMKLRADTKEALAEKAATEEED